MTKIKKIASCVCATVLMLTTSVVASAEDWSIDYTYGAPSNISNQLIYKQYIGLSPSTHVYVDCTVTTGSIKISTSGFNPSINSLIYYAPIYDQFLHCTNPDPAGCTVTIRANENRVVAYGTVGV